MRKKELEQAAPPNLFVCNGFVPHYCGPCVHGKPHEPVSGRSPSGDCSQSEFHCVMRGVNQKCLRV